LRCRRRVGGRRRRDREQDGSEGKDERHHRTEDGDRRAVERAMGDGRAVGGHHGRGSHRKLRARVEGSAGDAEPHAGTNRVIGRQGISLGGWQDEGSRRHLGRGGGKAQQERKDGNRDGGGDSAEHAPADQGTNQAGLYRRTRQRLSFDGKTTYREGSAAAIGGAAGSPRAPPANRAGCMSLVSGSNGRSLQ
jgi:hypothetical protein